MLAADRLGKRYGERWLFRRLTFTVQPGECLVILGDNGSGKSTLLRILAGLIPPTEGSRRVDRDPRTALGYAALDQPVYPELTVGEHLELAGRLRGVEARTQPLLQQVELDDAIHVLGKALSTGMRSRLKLALAIQAQPKVLLLDEPGAGLDEGGRRNLERTLRDCAPLCAVVLATNDERERRWATHELRLESRIHRAAG